MSAAGWLSVYCLLILGFSLLGGYIPFIGQLTHSRLQVYLSLSAGVMLGASFFHVMPDALEKSGEFWFGCWMSAAIVGLFFIERFIAPHSHEIDAGVGHQHGHGRHDECCGHGHIQVDDDKKIERHSDGEHRAAAPAVAGWMAVLGLSIHTFMNGFGLAGSVFTETAQKAGRGPLAAFSYPGLAFFLAIVCHKPFDALAISTVLSRKGTRRKTLLLVQLGFALMVPVGVAVFWLLRRGLGEEGFEKQLTGAALAFSAGTFLFIALSDLLPEVQFHRHDRVLLFLSLVVGVLIMGGIALLEGHDHEGNDHDAHGQAVREADHDRGPGDHDEHEGHRKEGREREQ